MNAKNATASILAAVALFCWPTLDCDGAENADIAIYGTTPAGIAAALAAAEAGRKVLLIEPTARIGGLTTHGLSHSDFHSFESLHGPFLQFSQRVLQHYRDTYGEDSEQVHDSWRGTHGEPSVNLMIFERMLAEKPTITVLKGHRLVDATVKDQSIAAARFSLPDNAIITVNARLFIDASYEGDLLAAAGVPYRVGREARSEYGESLAPKTADDELQGYNLRLCMTQNPENRVPIPVPENYNREDYAALVPLVEAGKFRSAFGYPGRPFVFKAHLPILPNGKHDINDVSKGLVRLSLPGRNQEYPDGDLAMRRHIMREHLDWQLGLLHFTQTASALPEDFRKEAATWGLCRDEFADTGHIPPQIYVREARRMVGLRIYTEADTEYAPNDARARLHPDSIALGEYSHNCHGTGHEGPMIGGKHNGEFYKGVAPYQIPYGVIVPKKLRNLLAPVACSASHVGFCALRLEPIWMSLGGAAGHAADLALKANVPLQRVDVEALQKRIWLHGGATIHVSDVPPDHPDFTAVQWWGNLGGWHGIEPAPKNPGTRGKHITSQYFEAFPGHAAKLDQPLDTELTKRWTTLATEQGLSVPDPVATRGDWIRSVFAASMKPSWKAPVSSKTDSSASPIMLAGDWLPDDPHQIDYTKLPRVPAEHVIISDVREHAGTRVHQHAYLAHHDGRFWAMWSDGPGGPRAGATPEQHRNIVPAHDMPGTRNSFATSKDGLNWSKPADLTGPPRIKGYGWIARGLWKRDGELLALSSHFNAPGYAGLGLSLEAFRWNGAKWEAHGTVRDDSMNNFPPKRLPSGEWMMTRRDHQRQVSVMIGGTKAFDDWRINPLAAYRSDQLSVNSDQSEDSATSLNTDHRSLFTAAQGGGRPEEPYWYILPDGKTIVGLIRDNGRSKFLLRTFSRDNGKTWSKMHRTNFPDATSKFFVHRTSRGYYVMVSNSNPRKRDPLTLAISEDGLVFTRLFWLIGGRHIDYPHIIEHDGQLLVAFSGAKQTMEVMKVSLDELERLAMPESVKLAEQLPKTHRIDLGDEGSTLWAATDLLVPKTGEKASFALATAIGAERVILGIDEQGQLTATLYQETVTGPKLEPGSRHTLLVRVHSHREKPDRLSVQLGLPGEIPAEPENWTVMNRKGASNANLSRVVLARDAAGFENVRIARTRKALAAAKVVAE
jgi:hypothetical protein